MTRLALRRGLVSATDWASCGNAWKRKSLRNWATGSIGWKGLIMAPTVQQIVKRLTAIEDRIEPRQPLYRWLDVYANEAEIDRQRAKARAEAEATGRKLVLISWQRPS